MSLKGQKHNWQDARFKKALEHAPDSEVKASEKTTSEILLTAQDALSETKIIKVVPAHKTPIWQQLLNLLTPKPNKSWGAGFATLVVFVGVGVIWKASNPDDILNTVPTRSIDLPELVSTPRLPLPIESSSEATLPADQLALDVPLPVEQKTQPTQNRSEAIMQRQVAQDNTATVVSDTFNQSAAPSPMPITPSRAQARERMPQETVRIAGARKDRDAIGLPSAPSPIIADESLASTEELVSRDRAYHRAAPQSSSTQMQELIAAEVDDELSTSPPLLRNSDVSVTDFELALQQWQELYFLDNRGDTILRRWTIKRSDESSVRNALTPLLLQFTGTSAKPNKDQIPEQEHKRAITDYSYEIVFYGDHLSYLGTLLIYPDKGWIFYQDSGLAYTPRRYSDTPSRIEGVLSTPLYTRLLQIIRELHDDSQEKTGIQIEPRYVGGTS